MPDPAPRLLSDAKGLLANERTFQDWILMAVNLSLVGISMLTLATREARYAPENVVGNAAKSAKFVGLVLTPLGIVFAIYAVRTFYVRRKVLNYSRNNALENTNGALAMGFLLLCSMCAILVVDIVQPMGTPVKP